MLKRIFGLFHTGVTGIYPYIAIVLLGFLSYGLYERGNVQSQKVEVVASKAELKAITKELKNSQLAIGALLKAEMYNQELLLILNKYHNALNENTVKAIEQIDSWKDGCLDVRHPDGFNRVLNDSGSAGKTKPSPNPSKPSA